MLALARMRHHHLLLADLLPVENGDVLPRWPASLEEAEKTRQENVAGHFVCDSFFPF